MTVRALVVVLLAVCFLFAMTGCLGAMSWDVDGDGYPDVVFGGAPGGDPGLPNFVGGTDPVGALGSWALTAVGALIGCPALGLLGFGLQRQRKKAQEAKRQGKRIHSNTVNKDV